MSKRTVNSIYDLADHLGVSASTVSRVLNGRAGIGEETRQRVLASAREAGFRPRMKARQLTVALVVDRNQYASYGGFISNLVSSLIQVISREEVAVELVTEKTLHRLHERLIDGVLALAWDDATLEEIRKFEDLPVVMLNRMDAEDFSAVATDHRRQAEMAVEYLHARGHRKIAMLCEERNNWGSRERAAGFMAAAKKKQMAIGEDAVVFTDHQPMYGVLRRLVSGLAPTAIFIAGEDMSLEACYILRDVCRMEIPKQISLLGMESPKVSQFLSPPMTTLAQPLDMLAERAMQVLLLQIEAGKRKVEHVVLDNTLIERESVTTLQNEK